MSRHEREIDGTLTRMTRMDPFVSTANCADCDTPLIRRVGSGRPRIRCAGCGEKRRRMADNRRRSRTLAPGERSKKYAALGRRGSIEDRFWIKVHVTETGCWRWLGALNARGYALFSDENGNTARAHRWAYERFRELIPVGLTLDHTCHNKSCVNPGHCEPVTMLENIKRYQARIMTT